MKASVYIATSLDGFIARPNGGIDDGGKTIQGFLSAGLVQQLIITTIPILIGSGIPLSNHVSGQTALATGVG